MNCSRVIYIPNGCEFFYFSLSHSKDMHVISLDLVVSLFDFEMFDVDFSEQVRFCCIYI